MLPILVLLLCGVAMSSAPVVAEPSAVSLAQATRSVDRIATRLDAELREPGVSMRPPDARPSTSVPFDLVAHTRRFYRELLADTPTDVSSGTLSAAAGLAHTVSAVEMGPAIVTSPDAPLRTEPSAAAGVIGAAARGAEIDLLTAAGPWRKVLLDSGAIGWMAADHLGTQDAINTANGRAIVQRAMQYMGVPYVLGGQSRAGMDCSGLVHTVMRSLGKRVPRTAATLYEVGTPVARDALRVGDLVFFTGASRPGITHVGIYAGDGELLHASSGIGSVGLSSLDAPYYSRHYAGARRVLP
jgi:cell wall-associated NlpC family hydrolase